MNTAPEPSFGEFTLMALFSGRRDCFFDSARVQLVWCDEAEWFTALVEHVRGLRDIGVYPRRDDGTCRWGCVDIDTGDFNEALAVYGALADMGVESWIEASGSWKDLSKRGYHVWVFADRWTETSIMRTVLIEAVLVAGLPDNTEINPKQIAATAKGVGNCVRLPYGERSRTHHSYSTMMFSPHGEFKVFSPSEFVEQVRRVSYETLEDLANVFAEQASMRKIVAQATARLRDLDGMRNERVSTGGQHQRAARILHGLDRASDGERNLCAFVISCYLKGTHHTLTDAEGRLTAAVTRSFDGGAEFLDEALQTLRSVYGREV